MSSNTLLNNKINSIIEQYSSGYIQESLEAIKGLINEYPKESILLNICGVIYKSTGQLEMAIQSFEQAIKITSDFADAHYNLGLTLQELNQLDDAVKSYEMTLSIQSNYAKAHNNLGIVFKELGKIDDSVKSYKQAIDIQPEFAEAHNNLGNVLFALGKFDDAIASYNQALAIQSDYFEVHNNLGNIFHELEQFDTALEFYEKALNINPDYAEAHNNLGITLKELGKLEEAVESYKKALNINPDYAEAHNNLGSTLETLTQYTEAIESYKKALNIDPDYAEAHNNLGQAFYLLNLTDQALDSFENALALNPEFVDAYNNMGGMLQDLGRLDEALNCYVSALAIEPDDAEIHRNLSTVRNYKPGDTQFDYMQSLLTNNNLYDSDRINLFFALAKAHEDLGNKDDFFKLLNAGNELRRKDLNYSIEKNLNIHSLYKDLFISTTNIIPAYEPLTIKPIFIVGMPRSGTSLVEQIVSSHHKVYGAGELSALDDLIVPMMNNYLSNREALNEKKFLSIRNSYSNILSNLDVSEKIITDKMPTNFENIGFILNAFPEAKIIHLKRDAMAICWSIYKHNFPTDAIGFPYNMEDLAQFYISYSEMMGFWHDQFPNKIYDLNYENLTTNQEDETKKLLEYCELDWDENCLNFHTNTRTVKTASSLQVKEKMYQGSSEAWKKYESYLKPLINALGYNK